MRILIMSCGENSWYKNRVGKTYPIKNINSRFFITKEGPILKKNAAIIER